MKCNKLFSFPMILITILFFSYASFAGAGNRDATVIFTGIKERNAQDVVRLVNDFFYDTSCRNGNKIGNMMGSTSDGDGVINYGLIYDAFIKNDANSLQEINAQLLAYKELPDNDGTEKVYPFGLDGIIVYSSVPKPRFMSLTTPRNYKHQIKTYYIKNINDKTSIQDAFCKAIPHYTGAP